MIDGFAANVVLARRLAKMLPLGLIVVLLTLAVVQGGAHRRAACRLGHGARAGGCIQAGCGEDGGCCARGGCSQCSAS